jgi:hypothetical protein
MPSYRGEYAPLHPRFPEGSAAACVRLDAPPPADIDDLVYTPADNVAIEEFVRQISNSTSHSVRLNQNFWRYWLSDGLVSQMGTIQMKPKEKGGCVDARLNVHGTTNLKVAGWYIFFLFLKDRLLIMFVFRPFNPSWECWCQYVLDCASGWRKGCNTDCRGSWAKYSLKRIGL